MPMQRHAETPKLMGPQHPCDSLIPILLRIREMKARREASLSPPVSSGPGEGACGFDRYLKPVEMISYSYTSDMYLLGKYIYITLAKYMNIAFIVLVCFHLGFL